MKAKLTTHTAYMTLRLTLKSLLILYSMAQVPLQNTAKIGDL